MSHKKEKQIRPETSFGDDVVHSLNDFFESVDRGEPVTVRTMKLDLRPAEYTPEDVRCTRAKLGVSQAVFAQLLAVDVKTVQAWEQGERPPTGPARRLLDEINQDPNRWLAQLKKSVETRSYKRTAKPSRHQPELDPAE